MPGAGIIHTITRQVSTVTTDVAHQLDDLVCSGQPPMCIMELV